MNIIEKFYIYKETKNDNQINVKRTVASCILLFLGAFAELRNTTINFVMSVCPSVRVK
jgi:hypothetical protein